MTPEEFNTWMANHYACYPRVRDFVEREDGTIRQWAKVLVGNCDLRHAMKASEMMLSKELVAPGYTDHPHFVLAASKVLAYKESSAKRSADEQSTRHHGEACGLCRGSGGVNVWDYGSHKRMRDGTFWETRIVKNYKDVDVEVPIHTRYQQSAACKCSKGDKFRRPACATYDEKEHVICNGVHDAESIQALQDFEGVADTVEAADGVKGRAWDF